MDGRSEPRVIRHFEVKDSAQIVAIGYAPAPWTGDLDGGTLEVVFKGRPSYIYRVQNIPCWMFCELMNAPSMGSYYATHIRNNVLYPVTKVARNGA